ncbi:MAG: hypothetical protein IT209_06300 [Armatimonadetes bacterium]|nr:hypothetical protein [Armatimonadota bacterium]
MKHANLSVALIEFILCFLILYKIVSARRGAELFIRKIPGLQAIDEAVGRATEMGRAIFYSPGIQGLNIVGLQSMSILSHILRLAAKFRTRVIVALADAVLFTIAQEVAREAYTHEGTPELYEPQDIQFLSDQQFAYASASVGVMTRERVASCFYFGNFFAESLILAETGHHVGAIQVAGTPETAQLPFFIAACDYTIIGDEYYAGSAYLSKEPTLLGSLVGQDWAKLVLIACVVLGVISVTVAGISGGTALGAQLGLDRHWPAALLKVVEFFSLPVGG